MPTLTLLHISDLHERGPRERDSGSRGWVLGDAWERNLNDILADGPLDLVCFTGDAAFSGKADEYARATEFFRAMLQRLNLGWDRFFLVPGNHDVDRDIGKLAWKKMREKLPRGDRSDIGQWLAGGGAPLGFRNREKEQIFLRGAAYREWVRDGLGLTHLDPASSPHGFLGYRKTLRLPGYPFDLHILGLDSAWMCGDKNDAGKLWLTAAQVMRLATENGRSLEGFRLCLVHHPLEELADSTEVRRRLAERVDFLLRGHLHEPEALTWADADRTQRGVAAGCLYERDQYPNACERIRLTLDDLGRLLRYEIWFRGWSKDGGFWLNDNSRYQETKEGRLNVHVAAAPAEPAEDARVAWLMVDRKREIKQLVGSLLGDGEKRPVATCAVQGMAGVGKSYLADRFIYLYKRRFPGGVHRLVLAPEEETVPTAESLLGDLAGQLHLPLASAGLADRIKARLLTPRSLLQVENVDSEAFAEAVAGLIGPLQGCPALVTGRFQGLGDTAGWKQVMVRPFDEETALAQLEEEMGPGVKREEKASYQRLVRTLGFLPLAVHLAAGYMRSQSTVDGFLDRLRRTGWALLPVDPTLLTREKTRALLASTFLLSLDLLQSELGTKGKRLRAGFLDLGHAPASGFGASLGAAIAGLPNTLEFEELTVAACRLSLLDSIPPSERADRAFRVHPLLAELLRDQGGRKGRRRALERMTDWFASRVPNLSHLPEQEKDERWKEILVEFEALTAAGSSAFQSENRERPTEMAQEKTDPDRAVEEERKTARALGLVADLLESVGDLKRAERIRREAELPAHKRLGDEWSYAVTMGKIAGVLKTQGHLEEALRIRYEEELPVYENLGDVQLRAATMGKIADVLQEQGNLEEALRILRVEELPIYERFGNVRSWAVTMGRIADVLQAQGNLEEALRIRREEQLPVYERLNDVRERAVAMGKIADVLQERGNLEEALRIRREEELPVYERFGDLREYALSMGKIAEIHEARGELDEAVRIRREEQIPIYERIGLRDDLLIAQANLAVTLFRRGTPTDREEAKHLCGVVLGASEQLSVREVIREILGKGGLLLA